MSWIRWIIGRDMEPVQVDEAYKPITATLPGNIENPALNTHSGTWKFIKVHLENEIKSLREKNDKLSLDAVATAAIRGQIKMAKKLLELENEKFGPDRGIIRSHGLATNVFGSEED